MTGSILKKMKAATKNAPVGVLKGVGLKNCHSYTLIDVKEVVLVNGDIDYLILMRNPTGNIYLKEDEVWKGDYGPSSHKWTPKLRQQCNYYVTEDDLKRAKHEMRQQMRAYKLGQIDPEKQAEQKAKFERRKT